MPVRRRVDKRRQAVTDEHEAWLEDDDKASGFVQYAHDDELEALWHQHSERIVADHVADHPGTRPARWWQYSSPEPRRRLSGIGTPACDVLAYKPTYSYGVPSIWITQRQVRYYSGTAVDIHGGHIGGELTIFKGVAIDPDDPPTFESEAAYMKRHGLFLAGEERRCRSSISTTYYIT